VRWQQRKELLIVGLCCGIAIAVRINNVLFVGPLLCWILLRDRRSFFWCMVPVLILGTLLAAYNYAMFGNVTGSYANGFNEPLLKGLAGLLFSPARGLLIYFPIATFSIAGALFAAQTRSIYVALSAFVLFSLILVSLAIRANRSAVSRRSQGMNEALGRLLTG
jgi:hypothetical protein